jgi:hypothetical protein
MRETHLSLPDALYRPERLYQVRIRKSGRAALSSVIPFCVLSFVVLQALPLVYWRALPLS